VDEDLYVDALKLRGIIKYRLGEAAEAIKYFITGKRMREIFDKKAMRVLR